MSERLTRLLPLLTAAAIAAGGAAHLAGAPRAGDAIWAVALAVVLVPLTVSVARSLRVGDVGVDAIALLAMAGALALGELLAGAVVALMLSGGNALEAVAAHRAKRELTVLLERAPRIAHRRLDGAVQEVAVDAVLAGDVVVVRSGEVVPVDGVVASATATIDESALTGEPLPIACATGDPVRSGAANAGQAFDLHATRLASESAYAAIVRLVQEAEHQRAPFVRMADRYAAFLLPVTVLLAGGCVGGQRGRRARPGRARRRDALPAHPRGSDRARVGGVARRARRHRREGGGGDRAARPGPHGPAGQDRDPHPRDAGGRAHRGPRRPRPDELLRLAASVDELSAHIVAEALVHDAEARGLVLADAARRDRAARPGIEGAVEAIAWPSDRAPSCAARRGGRTARRSRPGRARAPRRSTSPSTD